MASATDRAARPSLKRFADGLTPGARRSRARFPHDASASYAPSSASTCRACGLRIARGAARVTLFLQCHLGYKDASLTHYVHVACLRAHPEAHKLRGGAAEVAGAAALAPADAARLSDELAAAVAAAAPSAAVAAAAPSAAAAGAAATVNLAAASAPLVARKAATRAKRRGATAKQGGRTAKASSR